MADDFEQMWRDLVPVGRSSSTGGYFRQPFGSAERECATWFREQAAARDLEAGRTTDRSAWSARSPPST